MNIRILYIALALIGITSCSKEVDGGVVADKPIRIDVVAPTQATRVHLLNDYNDILAEPGFTLDAYLKTSNELYIDESWVYFFNGNWRFRDVVNQGNLIDFYWPNDDNVNFLSYIPRDLNQCVVNREDISFSNTDGVVFNCELPGVIYDRTDEEREIENAKREFVYACRLNQGKAGGDVKLHFVHPFAVINFRLMQSHRDLTIHSIILSGLGMSGTYSNANDTYESYAGGQSSLTYECWTGVGSSDTLVVEQEKGVPNPLNYSSHIGGPYIVIPQVLKEGAKDVKLSIKYSWDTVSGQTTRGFSIATVNISAWQPGMKYTYYLDLGDNKEEIIFKVLVEPWEKGEDDDYENNFEVK